MILGGARSGKSARAEALVQGSGLRPVYVATAEPLDPEMALRIEHHRRRRRGAGWRTLEEPLALPELLAAEADPDSVLLVDCLTLWLTNLMVAGREVEAACDALIASLAQTRGPVVLVSNEVGQGVVPADAMSRAFVDHAGRLHQRLAALADWVQLVTAGLAQDLKRGQRSS